jgi:hypothetical protein
MATLRTDEFFCHGCKEVFTKAWTDEEARAEALRDFGPSALTEEVATLCEDCYRLMLACDTRREERH